MTLEEVPNTASTTANAAYVNSINDAGPVTIFGIIDLTNGATCNVAPFVEAGEAAARRAEPGGREADFASLLQAATRRLTPGPN